MALMQIRYFVAVCESGSLTGAAKSLFVTQPALSSAIHHIEKEYNLKLFERKNHGLVLTEDGDFFYRKAKQILFEFDVFEKDLHDISQKKYTIRIGVPLMIGSFLFPQIYSHRNSRSLIV